MKRNISGLHGRNVTFFKGLKLINAYILKYTDCGEYYALSKSDGSLYKFSAGAASPADYTELEKYGIAITKENWRRYVDFNYKNPYFGRTDILELCKSVACAVCLICLMVCAVCLAVSVDPFPYQVYAVFIFLGTVVISLNLAVSVYYFKTDGKRAALSSYSVYDDIDYSALNMRVVTEIRKSSPNVYRTMLLISAATLASTVMHVKEGILYSAGGITGAAFLIISLAVLGILLKKGVEIKEIKWCVLAISMITYLLATLESNFWAKPIQLVLAAISVGMFVKRNRKPD